MNNNEYKNYIYDIKINKKKQKELLHKIKREVFFIWPETHNHDQEHEYENILIENKRYEYIYTYYTFVIKELKKKQHFGEDISKYWDDLLAEIDTNVLLEQRNLDNDEADDTDTDTDTG